MKKRTLFLVISLFTIAYFYFLLPILKFGFSEIILLIILIPAVIYANEYLKKSRIEYYRIPFLIPMIFWLTLLICITVMVSTSLPLFHSQSYQKLIGEVKIGQDFSEHLAPISSEEIAIVDNYTAYRLGDKVMGSIPSLGSQTLLGHFTLQKINNQLFWVAPLLHSGFFKWKTNREGTPGYIMVSATNERDVKLVQRVHDRPVKIKYQPNAYFSDDLSRHIYFNGFMKEGFTDFTFELDDTGNPYWVISLYEKRVGFSGEEVVGVITVDPATGAIKKYSLEDAPKWIDRIQPASFVINQLNDWGEYVNGYWNLSNKDKLMTTSGVTIVFGPDNQSYWYTGLTSVGNDEGSVGFVLINTRSKETTWYKQVGATEEAAMMSAMGKVQEKRYNASFPVTYNINGVPTYVMSLKDQAGLIKMIAMVSVKDYTIVGVGNGITETLRAYKNALNSQNNDASIRSESLRKVVKDKILRIGADVKDGNTYYYFTTGQSDAVYVATSSISNELILTQQGDSIQFEYNEDKTDIIDLITFKNLEFR